MNEQRSRNLAERLACTVFILSLIGSNLAVFGQTPRGKTVASKRSSAVAKCSAAWTGTVGYSRTQSTTNNKRVERVSNRGYDTTNFEMKYDYNARVAVTEAKGQPSVSQGKAAITHSMSSTETVDAVEKNSCDRGKSWRDMRGTSTSQTNISGQAQSVDANVNVGVNQDGTYSVSVGVPQIRGRVSGSQSSSFSGQCTSKPGKDLQMPSTETSIDGHSLTSDGSDRINENDPNRIAGSYSLRSPGDVTETITWNLQKCGAPLRLTDLRFEDMKFPNWDDWKEIVEQTGTIDGNWVKVKAKVLNASGESKQAEISFKETYKGDKWDGAKPDMPLKDNTVYVSVDAGEEREVEILWDTSGYAWYDDGRPRYVQRVKAEIWEKNKLVDDMTKNIKIAPKPLVLVHGLWSNWKAWETWQNILTTSHSYDWKAFPVGENAGKGVLNTGGAFLSTTPTASIGENARQLESYIKYAQEDRNAWHVDVVAHSLGGLISRYYISQIMPPSTPDGRPKIEHLIMLGTPNMGSPCADVMNFAFEMVGKNVEAVRQLQQDYVAGFNRINKNRKGVKFSALAGDPLPTMCKTIAWNDGVVSTESAIWEVADNAKTKSLHTDLTGTSDFSAFVKPRLAIGPRGDHDPAMPGTQGQTAMNGAEPTNTHRPAIQYLTIAEPAEIFSHRVYGAKAADNTPFAKAVTVGPKQKVEVEIPLPAGINFGITFMADPLISTTLIDDKGAIVGKNLAGSAEAGGWFRSIFYDKQTKPAVWKLQIENTDSTEHEAVLTTWSSAVK